MNQKNFEYLRDQVKFSGFGEGLENELKQQLQKGGTEFTLYHHGKFNNEAVDSALHFKKSDQTDLYFFNSYQVQVHKEKSPTMEQTFYVNKHNNITLKEAYNLMSGRAVNKDLTNKEDQVYNAWIQMDFKQTDASGNYKLKQFHQNYGYDLKAALAKFPIKEIGNEVESGRLIESLQKGNLQAVTLEREGKQQKHFIEANPQFKTITMYDSGLQRINRGKELGEKVVAGESAQQSAKRETPQAEEEGGGRRVKSSVKKKKGHAVS